MPGNVTIRFGVQDQEVVRKALEALGKDGEAALRKLDAAGKQPTRSMRAVSDAVGDLRSQALGMAQSMGPVGTALIALGPWGLAAGAAIGGVMVALNALSQSAHNFAGNATQLHNTAQLLGLTTTQLDAVTDAGSDFALSGEKINAFLTRFAAQLEEVHRHEGQLFELLQRIDPAIARQMSTARGTAEALDLLGKAAERASDRQRAALARMTGGRGGGDVLLLIREIATKQGGVGQLTEEFQKSGDALDENLVKRVKLLKTQIDDMAGDARRNFESIFSEQMLQAQHRSTEQWREFSRLARDFALSPDLDRFLAMLAGGLRTQEFRNLTQWMRFTPLAGVYYGAQALGATAPKPKPMTPEELARARLRMGLMQGFRGQLDDVWQPDLAPRPVSPTALFNDARRNMGILGSAATPAEQLDLKQKELNAAVEKFGKDILPLTNRALAAYKLELDKQAVAIRVRLGVASAEEQMAVRLRELQDQRAKGFIKSDEEMAAAEQLLRRELEATLRQQEVRRSLTPQLTQLSIEARDLTANIDRDMTGALRNSGQEMLRMLDGTDKLGAGLKKLGTNFLEAGFNALWMRTVIGPLASLGSGALSALGLPGSFQFAGAGSTAVGIAGSARGNIFAGGRLVPFARGGVLSRPIMFPFANGIGLAGEAGPEAIMPLKRDARSGRLGVETNGGGGTQVNVFVENEVRGADVSVRQERNASGGADLRIAVRQTVREDIGRGEFDGAMGGRFGNRPSRVRR